MTTFTTRTKARGTGWAISPLWTMRLRLARKWSTSFSRPRRRRTGQRRNGTSTMLALGPTHSSPRTILMLGKSHFRLGTMRGNGVVRDGRHALSADGSPARLTSFLPFVRSPRGFSVLSPTYALPGGMLSASFDCRRYKCSAHQAKALQLMSLNILCRRITSAATSLSNDRVTICGGFDVASISSQEFVLLFSFILQS